MATTTKRTDALEEMADALQRTLWEIAKRDGEGNVIPDHALRAARYTLAKHGFAWKAADLRSMGFGAGTTTYGGVDDPTRGSK